MKNYCRTGHAPIAMMKRFLLCGLLLVALPGLSFAQGGVVEYYHLDALGTVRAVTNEAGVVLETHNYLPFGEELCPSGGTYVVCGATPAGQPKRFTGKERDTETGLDYFGARYYRANVGRFTTTDPLYTWEENLVDPQRWNRYAYVRNNPLKHIDPDGRAIETPWDAANVAIGIASLGGNIAAGNVGGAILDVAGLVYDGAATVVPGLPGGAGSAIRSVRAADKVADIARAGDRAADVAKAARGGETAATKAGREAHRQFAEKVKAKTGQGWQSEPKIIGPTGKTLKPDAISPGGRPVELKPNSPSGRRRGEAQLKGYEEATGKQGRVVYYDK